MRHWVYWLVRNGDAWRVVPDTAPTLLRRVLARFFGFKGPYASVAEAFDARAKNASK